MLSRLESPDTVIVRPATATLTLRELFQSLDGIQSRDETANVDTGRSREEEEEEEVGRRMPRRTNPSFYVEYLQLEQYLPTLQEDATVPSYANFLHKTHQNIWIGGRNPAAAGDNSGKGTTGKLHFDP